MEIRNGHKSEIENFQLYSEDNAGEKVLVAESNGQVVGYAQVTGNRIFFMESEAKGAGRALIQYLKSQNDYLVAVNCVSSARGFYEKMNFQPVGKENDYDWYEGDD